MRLLLLEDRFHRGKGPQMDESLGVLINSGKNEPDSPDELAPLWSWSPREMLNSLFHTTGDQYG